MRKATTIKPIIWVKPNFKRLSTKARLTYLFLISGPNTSPSGLFSYSVALIADSTGLNIPEVRLALIELVDAGRVLWDEDWSLFLILRWVKHNPLTSPKLKKSAENEIQAFENHPFFRIAEFLIEGGDPDRVSDTVSDRVSNTVSDRVGDTPQGQGQVQGQGSDHRNLGNCSLGSSSCSESDDSKHDKDSQPVQLKVFPHEAKEMGRLLGQHMIDNDPKAKLPTTEKQKEAWIGEIEKLNRIDDRSWDEIRAVINWCQNDEFWKTNILSAGKLRKKFPQLLLKMTSNPKQKTGAGMEARGRKVLAAFLENSEVQS